MNQPVKPYSKSDLRDYYNERFLERYSESNRTAHVRPKDENRQYLTRYFSETLRRIISNNLNSGDCVLDLGCGEGNNVSLIQENYKNIVATDFSFTALKYLEQRYKQYTSINIINSDGAYLPFKNDYFDFVICIEVIEHIMPPDSQKLINEIFRVLRRKGGGINNNTEWNGNAKINLRISTESAF